MAEQQKVRIDNDVEEGIRHVAGELSNRKSAAFVGRGGNAFTLIVGAPFGSGVISMGPGVAVAVPLTEAGLRALVDRALTLLGESPSTPSLPQGLKLG